jgi:hypothetical protein
MVNSDTGSGGWVELSDERIEVRIERGLIAGGQSARQATARPRSVSCCWQNVGRERLGPGSGWWVGGEEAAQIHVIPHRAAREVLAKFSASLPSHTIRVVCGNATEVQKEWGWELQVICNVFSPVENPGSRERLAGM